MDDSDFLFVICVQVSLLAVLVIISNIDFSNIEIPEWFTRLVEMWQTGISQLLI